MYHFVSTVKYRKSLLTKEIENTIKSILAKEIFKIHPEVKKQLWGGQFWTDGFYVNTVSKYGGEKQIERYIQNQGKTNKTEYKVIQKNNAQDLFEILN